MLIMYITVINGISVKFYLSFDIADCMNNEFDVRPNGIQTAMSMVVNYYDIMFSLFDYVL